MTDVNIVGLSSRDLPSLRETLDKGLARWDMESGCSLNHD